MKSNLLSVSLVRHYLYCPRTIYWRVVSGLPWRTGRIAEILRRSHDRSVIDVRKLSSLRNCEVMRDVRLVSERLGFAGILDALVRCSRELRPLEVKRGREKKAHRIQLAVYGLLVEENFEQDVSRGFLYYPRKRGLMEVDLRRIKPVARRIMLKIRKIVEDEVLPPPTRQRWRCFVCDHYLYCQGV